jgi:hypothetical protein
MRIGFDLDKVFINYPPLVPYFIIDRLSKKPTQDLSYRFPGNWEKKVRIWSHTVSLRPPIEKNIEVLEELSRNKKLDLYLISGRYSFLKKRTQEWFKKYNLDKNFKRMYFDYENEQPHIWKNKILRQLQIEKYIDDDLELLLYLAEQNPTIQFYWLTQASFFPKALLLPNVTPIRNLAQFQENIYREF